MASSLPSIFQFHWMDSKTWLPRIVDVKTSSFNSIEWIPHRASPRYQLSSAGRFFQFHWMDSGSRVSLRSTLGLNHSFNSIEWIRPEGKEKMWGCVWLSFNSIEWIPEELQHVLMFYHPYVFQFHWMDSRYQPGSILRVAYQLNFQFHWMDSNTNFFFFPTTHSYSFNSIEWIRGILHEQLMRFYPCPFNSIEWIQELRDSHVQEAPALPFNSIEWIQRRHRSRLYRVVRWKLSIPLNGFLRLS